MLITITDYHNEIDRIQTALNATTSPKQRKDYTKYLARLKRELRGAQERENERRKKNAGY